jgi:hypothetical protein
VNVSSRDAAAMYGCCTTSLMRAMRESGVAPEVRFIPNKHGGVHEAHYWNPAEVMRVRAERKVKALEARLLFATRAKSGMNKPTKRGATLARATRAETFRKQVLQRIANRQLSVR